MSDWKICVCSIFRGFIFPTFLNKFKLSLLGKKILYFCSLACKSISLLGQKKITHFRKCGWRKKSSPGRPKIYFFNQFSGYFLFCSLGSFAFLSLVLFCVLVWCFLKLKIYILIHIWLCGWISDKNIFTWPISRNKATCFFGLTKKKNR